MYFESEKARMARKMSISGLGGYEATTKDDLPSPPDPEYQYGSLAQGAKHLNLSPEREISASESFLSRDRG